VRSAGRFTALFALIAASLVAPLTATALASSGHSAHRSMAAAVPMAGGGIKLWAARYNIPYPPQNTATAVAVSPDGSTVFVTGTALAFNRPREGTWWATVAYDAATGRRLWAARYRGPVNRFNSATALAVSPDGSTVFVGGDTEDLSHNPDATTVAYNAATGAMVWARQVSNGGGGSDVNSLAVSPDGSSVYVTGGTGTADGSSEATTVAYGAATGDTLWTTTYGVPGSGFGGVAVSPDGSTVYASGNSNQGSSTVDLTAAYEAATGTVLWVRTYLRAAGGANDAGAVAVSPDGSAVYVTGYGRGESGRTQAYQTIAYNSAGTRLWVRRYRGARSSDTMATHLEVSPDGSRVFVTGEIHLRKGGFAYGTVAYSVTGALLWASHSGGNTLGASGLALSPDGSRVYVTATSYVGTGERSVYTTVAYDAANGARSWLRRYYGTGQTNEASSVAVSPDGSRVFVTGLAQIPTSQPAVFYYGYATVAYPGG
jgi:DNA-binding beta-propeller fold protein YncE